MTISMYHIDRKLLRWVTKTNWQELWKGFKVYLAAAMNEGNVKEIKYKYLLHHRTPHMFDDSEVSPCC